MEIKVTLLDESIKRVQAGTTISQLARTISSSLSKNAIAGKRDEMLYLFVVGEKERNSSEISVRQRWKGDMGLRSLTEMAQLITEEIQSKR